MKSSSTGQRWILAPSEVYLFLALRYQTLFKRRTLQLFTENLRTLINTCLTTYTTLNQLNALLIRCLYDRSKNINTKPSVISEEKKHLSSHWSSVLVSNGYPYSFVTKGLFTWRGPQEGEVTCGALPHLTCKRDHIKMRDYMDRRVTPPKWVTSLPGVPHLHVNRP